jgi:hypothetical protein
MTQPAAADFPEHDPRFATPELDELYQKFRQIVIENRALRADCQLKGGILTDNWLIENKVDMLAAMLWPATGTEEQRENHVRYQISVELRVNEALHELQREIHKAQLAAGSQMTPAQIAEMARRQGNGHTDAPGGLILPPGFQRGAG